MTGITTVLIAGSLGIVGTAVGGFLAARAAAQAQEHNARATRGLAENQEFRAAIIECCTAVMIYRGAELDRNDARQGGQTDLTALTARVYLTRTNARNALYRVDLATSSKPLATAVGNAFSVAKSVKDARSKEELQERRNQTEIELEKVTGIARDELNSA